MIAHAIADPAAGLVWGLAATSLVGLPLYAGRVRGRAYAIFGLVILLVSLPGALVMHVRITDWLPAALVPAAHLAFAYSVGAAGVHLLSLVHARLRTTAFRRLVSVPGMAFIAAGALSGLWLLALLPFRALLHGLDAHGLLDALRWLDVLPFAVALASVATSRGLRHETVYLQLDGASLPAFARVPVERRRAVHGEASWSRAGESSDPGARTLRIVQISDPHLGPWQPRERLRQRIAELIAREPDLVLLTGDFLTMEGAGTPGALAEALTPLRPLAGRSFACLGNHDHEALLEVRSALQANGVHLLVDDETIVDTPRGAVQIVGADYVGRGRREHLARLLARFPRREDALRILMLHDPAAFHALPDDDIDLVLSGHTHGGQLGLVSLGLDWTVLSRTRWPDHGLFGRGRARLYVHRGTGFYGFPLRIGVPGELSLLEISAP